MGCGINIHAYGNTIAYGVARKSKINAYPMYLGLVWQLLTAKEHYSFYPITSLNIACIVTTHTVDEN